MINGSGIFRPFSSNTFLSNEKFYLKYLKLDVKDS